MHMPLAGTNLSNEQPETGRVIVLSGHAARRCGRRACSIRFMVPMHSKKRKGALHEPYSQLIENEWIDQTRFMVPMHAKKRKGALHEPPPLPALSPALGGGEGGRRPGEGDSERFMVPMRSEERKGALHEPGTCL